MKYSGFRGDVKPHVLTFSTSGQRQLTTCCTCAVMSPKKCHVSVCRRQAGDVCCLRCLVESDARQHGIYLFYIITKSLFYFKIFQHNAKAGLLPRLCPAFARKKPFDVIYDLYKMKQFHWLLCVAKNCDWSRKIVPLSNLT